MFVVYLHTKLRIPISSASVIVAINPYPANVENMVSS
jgi:hypothetical protein